MSKISFITGSSEKFAEASLIVSGLQRVDCDLPEIQELDQKKIIHSKLLAAQAQGYENIIVEDTGLYFESLKFSLPGPLIKWFVKSLGNEGLSDLGQQKGLNSAYALTTIGYLASSSSQALFFEGKIEGTIVTARGSGFGWDAIFQPNNSTLTLGEMSPEDKTAISHRGKAFTALAQHLSRP